MLQLNIERDGLGRPSCWRPHRISGAADAAALAAEAEHRLAIGELNHDVAWLEAGKASDDDIVALADRSNGALCGLMPIRIARERITYTVGNVRVLALPVRQYNLVQGPLTSKPNSLSAMAQSMEALADLMPPTGAVFASAVPVDGAFNVLLADRASPVRKRFHVLKWGDANWHCKIDWSGTVEAYLASLGADSRRNFKRYDKKLFANEELEPRVECFRTAADIDRFLDDGIKVSDKTYQKKLLGLGLARGGATERRFRFAAERQGFLGHILYLGGAPAAFHYGFVYHDTFFVVQMGYDPAFAPHQPGAVLFLHVLKDVERLKLPVRTIDCLPGVTDFKLRTTNRKEAIQNYYLFKRSLGGTARFAALYLLDAAVWGLKSLAARAKLAERMRRAVTARGG